jgi:hypothetical protein
MIKSTSFLGKIFNNQHGGVNMKTLTTMMLLLCISIFAGCGGSEVGDGNDDQSQCEGLCHDGEICVQDKCYEPCLDHDDCIDKHGAGWRCQQVDGFAVGYCALQTQTDGDQEGDVPTTPTCVPKSEICNGVDDNCNGQVDEGVTNACGGCGDVPEETCNQVDDDCDGQVDEGVTNACGGCGDVPEEICNGQDDDCDGQIPEIEQDHDGDGFRVCQGDCNDLVPTMYPGADELCNGLDDDCDGQIPDGEIDQDLDGFMVCQNDCDDTTDQISPVMTELCNGIDDNCNGEDDEGFHLGVPCIGVGVCGPGVYECLDDNNFHCSSMPSGTMDGSTVELCSDNVDNDCDGSVDEGCECDEGDLKLCGTSEVGQCEIGLQTCQADGTWGECLGAIEPVPELCNGLDDDCDGQFGPGEVDIDQDGEMVCAGDCNDGQPLINSSAQELCNNIDDDCDALVDEDYHIGVPCFGWGLCGQGVYECDGENGFVCSTMPGASGDESELELCSDNLDNNCNGSVDEGCECDEGDLKYCGTTDQGVCQIGLQTCLADGTWDVCIDAVEPVPELCNGLDDDCDGLVNSDELDQDGDGFRVCDQDCNDLDSDIYPGNTDACDGVDNNCDGQIDEGYFVGAPCNGLGSCGAGTLECNVTGDGTLCSTSLNGSEDASVNEACGDNVDNDCDGLVDEDCACDPGEIEPCGSSNVGSCQFGQQTCQVDGTWGTCLGAIEPVDEFCNQLDDDCDGVTDENVTNACGGCGDVPEEICNGLDDDCDDVVDEGFINLTEPCTVGVGECETEGTLVCSGDGLSEVCDALPLDESDEVCDGLDNDCDGQVDEGFFVGAPCNGLGSCGAGNLECNVAGDSAMCSTAPDGSEDSSDAETCGNNVDDDCDGSVDEGCECDPGDTEPCGSTDVGSCQYGAQTCQQNGTWGECEGSIEPKAELCNGVDDDCNGQLGDGEVDEDQDGEMICAGDCADDDPMINTTADELCDDIDNNCNGDVDEGYFVGAPCNGLGSCGAGTLECNVTGDGSMCSTSLNGSEDASGDEICGDNVDNDCDGSVDEGCECDPGETEQCGSSSVGACQYGIQTCFADGTWGSCLGATEPQQEVCNDIDDDCDGGTDEGISVNTFFPDVDNDGQGQDAEPDDGIHVVDCMAPEGYVGNHDDCDDGDPNVYKGAEELCNGVDDDCDGEIDEGFLGLGDECDLGVGECLSYGTIVCGPTGAKVSCEVEKIFPQDELCDGLDNDCDGQTDEDFFVGAPCNGLGTCGAGTLECNVAGDSAMCSTSPTGSEDASDNDDACGDNVDNDCDGSVDEGCECDPGDTEPCGSTDVGPCEYGVQTCQDDGLWGECEGSIEPKAELCNGVDDDCNGQLGDGEVDEDQDGEMVCAGDCADDDPMINTTANELCDDIDNNCDGEVDEGFHLGVPCWGFGACGQGVYECASLYGFYCSTMPGASSDQSSDEVCGDNMDNNCDGTVDNGCECDPGDIASCGTTDVGPCQYGVQTCMNDGTWGNCQGNVEPSPETCDGQDSDCNGQLLIGEVDEDEDGFMLCQNDCDDTNPDVNPDVGELCNGSDDNCDGQIDEGYFIGVPCIGMGACGEGVYECASLQGTQCSSVVDSSTEVCGDNVDNDCDGSVDQGCDCDPFDLQICGTTDVGVCTFALQVCQDDGTWADCENSINPTPEVCNGLDDDCNGLTPASEVDSDQDGYRICEGDCDDANPDINPGAEELCDNVDNDCDGQVDEGCPIVTCNICCGFGLGHPVVWWGGDPTNTWSGEGYCSIWTGTVQQICQRGQYPIDGYTDAGWVDWNCQNGNDWGGWDANGVLWCVDQDGSPVNYEVVSGQVDPEDPAPEGEVILLDGLCSE